MRIATWVLIGATFLAGGVACSGSQTGTTPEGTDTAAPVDTGMATAAPTSMPTAAPTMTATAEPTASTPPPPAKPAWKDMNFDQRKEVMKTVVMPLMSKEFQEVDAKKFKDFSCTTCHGAGAKDGKFKMPNPALPKLSPKDSFKKHMDKSPKITEFMMKKVTPEMQQALNAPPFDMATHEGFGCGACHLISDK